MRTKSAQMLYKSEAIDLVFPMTKNEILDLLKENYYAPRKHYIASSNQFKWPVEKLMIFIFISKKVLALLVFLN